MTFCGNKALKGLLIREQQIFEILSSSTSIEKNKLTVDSVNRCKLRESNEFYLFREQKLSQSKCTLKLLENCSIVIATISKQ